MKMEAIFVGHLRKKLGSLPLNTVRIEATEEEKHEEGSSLPFVYYPFGFLW